MIALVSPSCLSDRKIRLTFFLVREFSFGWIRFDHTRDGYPDKLLCGYLDGISSENTLSDRRRAALTLPCGSVDAFAIYDEL